MKQKLIFVYYIIFLFLQWPGADFAKAQRVMVSTNGRYLVKSDGTPFFYMGDTAWELFHRLNREEAEMYLENRRKKGFNVIQAVALAELDGLGSPNAYGDLPLVNKDPVKIAVTPENDPADTLQYDYWDHVDWIVNKAAEKGMYIGLLPSWGEWVLPRFGPQYFTDEKQAYFYGHFIGDRYKNHHNIIWILGGDRHPDEKPDGFVIWQAMAEGIADGTNNINKPDDQADYTTTCMTYHSFPTSSKFFHQDPWIDFHMWGSYHMRQNDSLAYLVATGDWNLPNHKPTINGEPAYEDHPINWLPEKGWFDDFDVRQIAYWSLFAGAHGHTYGCHPIWQFYTPASPDVSPTRRSWQEAVDLPGSFQMIHVRHLMESRPMLNRVPEQSLIVKGQQSGMGHIRATRGDDYVFVYIPTGATVSVQLGKISGKMVNAWWFDPKTGKNTCIGKFNNTGVRAFDPPGEEGRGNDWVLVLDDASKKFALPGVVK